MASRDPRPDPQLVDGQRIRKNFGTNKKLRDDGASIAHDGASIAHDDASAQPERLRPPRAVTGSAAGDEAANAHYGASTAHNDASAGDETASDRAKRLAALLEEVGMDLLPALLVQLPFLFILGMLTLLLGERLLPASASWATHLGVSAIVSVLCARALGKRVLLPSVPYLGW